LPRANQFSSPAEVTQTRTRPIPPVMPDTGGGTAAEEDLSETWMCTVNPSFHWAGIGPVVWENRRMISGGWEQWEGMAEGVREGKFLLRQRLDSLCLFP
jgi:hypothetical protein